MGGDTYFFGVTSGDTWNNRVAEGWLVTPNGYTDMVKSGPFGNGYMPERDYYMMKPEAIGADESSMHPSGTKPKGRKKIRLIAKADFDKGTWKKDENGRPLIWDEALQKWRSGVLAHCDGPSKPKDLPDYKGFNGDGSEGCAAYQNCDETQKQLINAIQNGDNGLNVRYFKTKEEAERAKNEYLQQLEQKKNGPSKTKKGAQLKEGDPTVVVGADQRKLGHKQTPTDQGAKVVEHSDTVFVGPLKLPVSGVGDATSDGSKINTGEETVQLR